MDQLSLAFAVDIIVALDTNGLLILHQQRLFLGIVRYVTPKAALLPYGWVRHRGSVQCILYIGMAIETEFIAFILYEL